jgi:hypothetical protein
MQLYMMTYGVDGSTFWASVVLEGVVQAKPDGVVRVGGETSASNLSFRELQKTRREFCSVFSIRGSQNNNPEVKVLLFQHNSITSERLKRSF